MVLSNILFFLTSYIISCVILFFIGSKLNLKEWFNQNNIRKVVGFIISLTIYSVGNIIMDKFNITSNYRYIVLGTLGSTTAITIIFIMANVLKPKKVSL